MQQDDYTSKSSRTSSSLSQYSEESLTSVNGINLKLLDTKYRHLIEEIIILKRLEQEKYTKIEEQRRTIEILGMKIKDNLMIRDSMSTFNNFAYEDDFDSVFNSRKSSDTDYYLIGSNKYRIDRPERFTQKEIGEILKIVKQHEDIEQHTGSVYVGRYKLNDNKKNEEVLNYEPILSNKKSTQAQKSINKSIDRFKPTYSVTFPQIETKLDEKPVALKSIQEELSIKSNDSNMNIKEMLDMRKANKQIDIEPQTNSVFRNISIGERKSESPVKQVKKSSIKKDDKKPRIKKFVQFFLNDRKPKSINQKSKNSSLLDRIVGTKKESPNEKVKYSLQNQKTYPLLSQSDSKYTKTANSQSKMFFRIIDED